MVQILADGRDPFTGAAREWQGLGPMEILGCGVIAPVIMPSPDGRRVSWVDYRDYVGVFARPVSAAAEKYEGKPWAIRDLHFDRQQYVAEIERASRQALGA